ncbi:MAG: LytTR family transcriptional regulator [Bacteroidetes bacterium]|nr:LytTR family transcriptional regulator [Bacteroidota bacterium]
MIVASDNDSYLFCKTKHIIAITSEKEYIRIFNPKRSCLLTGSLCSIIDELPNYFIKPHKSYIINMKRIKKIRPLTRKKYLLTMENGMEIPLTKTTFQEIIEYFK